MKPGANKIILAMKKVKLLYRAGATIIIPCIIIIYSNDTVFMILDSIPYDSDE